MVWWREVWWSDVRNKYGSCVVWWRELWWSDVRNKSKVYYGPVRNEFKGQVSIGSNEF